MKLKTFSALFLLLMLLPLGASQQSNQQIDLSSGTILGDSHVDNGVLVTPSNQSGTYISQQFEFENYEITSIRTDAQFYSDKSSANVTLQLSSNQFQSVRTAIKKEINESSQSYDIGELEEAGTYRVVVETENAVDLKTVTIERIKKGRRFQANLPFVGSVDYQYRIPTIPYFSRIIAALVVFGFFSVVTYRRRMVTEWKIEKFESLLKDAN